MLIVEVKLNVLREQKVERLEGVVIRRLQEAIGPTGSLAVGQPALSQENVPADIQTMVRQRSDNGQTTVNNGQTRVRQRSNNGQTRLSLDKSQYNESPTVSLDVHTAA